MQNRGAAPNLFLEELADALALLAAVWSCAEHDSTDAEPALISPVPRFVRRTTERAVPTFVAGLRREIAASSLARERGRIHSEQFAPWAGSPQIVGGISMVLSQP